MTRMLLMLSVTAALEPAYRVSTSVCALMANLQRPAGSGSGRRPRTCRAQV
jgi:hypothetical protein